MNEGIEIPSSILSKDQLSVAEKVLNGDSIFLTGPAGSGKSFLFRYLIQELRKRFPQDGAIAVTAPTGIAAVNINGNTIHSWAGIGQGKADASTLCTIVGKNRKAPRRWRSCRVLMIDEISMLDSALFHKLSQVGKYVRSSDDHPFGGLQLVCCGDFFQLPVSYPLSLFVFSFCFVLFSNILTHFTLHLLYHLNESSPFVTPHHVSRSHYPLVKRFVSIHRNGKHST